MKLDEGLSQAFTLAHPPWKHPTVLPAALALQSLFAHGKIQPQRSLQLQRTDARWVKGAPPITATILTFTVARLLRPGIHMFLLQKKPHCPCISLKPSQVSLTEWNPAMSK